MISCALFISLFLQVLLSSQYTDALLVWTAPPPAWNQTVAGSNNVQTAVMQVLQGTTNYQVTWKYNLLGGQTIRFKLFSIRYGSGVPDDIGDVVTGKTPVLYNRHDYMARFRLNSTSKFSTLTINRITQKENATFQCRMQEAGENAWAYNVRIEVIEPPSITNITRNQTVIVAKDVTTLNLYCIAVGRPAPNVTWIKVSDNRNVTFPLKISGEEDEGTYRCTADNGVGNSVTRDVFITVLVPPGIADVSNDQVVCKGSLVTLSCNATGRPTPTITWTKVEDNGTDSAPLLPVVYGKSVLSNIQRSANGTYRCTAHNGVGTPVNHTVRVKVECTVCYEYPSGNSSVPITVNCAFPENLCFKYENTTANGEQVTIQGCTSADQCRQFKDQHLHCCEGHLCNGISVMNNTTSEPENPTRAISKVIYISVGVTSAFLLLSVAFFVWCYRRKKLKTIERSPDSQQLSDKWEILLEQIQFEEELGRGAFGVVYKATFSKSDEMEALVTESSKWPVSSRKPKAPQVVAVKVLHDDPSETQKEEFKFEIEQMKMLGSHKNVVSMVGCCTLGEKVFLVIDYVPCGDLLTWLRRRREKINQLQASERSYADKEELKDQGETRDQEKQAGKLSKKTTKEEQARVTMEMTSLRQSDVPKDMVSVTYSLPDQRFTFNNEAMDDEHSPHQEEVNTAVSPPQSDKDAVLEEIPSTSTKHQDGEAKVTDKELLSSQVSTGKSQAKPSPAMPPLIGKIDEDLSSDEKDEEESFQTKQLFSFTWQIAKGMNHLAENNLVHRDLAARNVLVGHDNQIKVSDFGLMRQIYEDVSSSAKSKKLPVKWMAPESLYQGLCTTKSDVWSFGVVLWEMVTLGGVPYPTLTNSELYRLLRTGYRMERPDMCSDDVYELMTDCWKEEPRSRPSFYQMIEKLEVIMQRDAPYLDLSKHDEYHPYYNVHPEACGD